MQLLSLMDGVGGGTSFAVFVCYFLHHSLVVSQPAPCPHGWVNRGPSCYAFITDVPDGWTEAEVNYLNIYNVLLF